MIRRWAALAGLSLSLAGPSLLIGCTPAKATGDADATPSTSVPTSPGENAALASARASARTATPAAASTPAKWSGKYASAAGSFSVPDGAEWSGVSFRGEDASDGVGEGALALVVDPKGRVEGSADGALGGIVITGVFADDAMTARLTRKDPGDRGFAGALFAKREGDRLVGTMRMSTSEGRVIRVATFTLANAP